MAIKPGGFSNKIIATHSEEIRENGGERRRGRIEDAKVLFSWYTIFIWKWSFE